MLLLPPPPPPLLLRPWRRLRQPRPPPLRAMAWACRGSRCSWPWAVLPMTVDYCAASWSTWRRHGVAGKKWCGEDGAPPVAAWTTRRAAVPPLAISGATGTHAEAGWADLLRRQMEGDAVQAGALEYCRSKAALVGADRVHADAGDGLAGAEDGDAVADGDGDEERCGGRLGWEGGDAARRGRGVRPVDRRNVRLATPRQAGCCKSSAARRRRDASRVISCQAAAATTTARPMLRGRWLHDALRQAVGRGHAANHVRCYRKSRPARQPPL